MDWQGTNANSSRLVSDDIENALKLAGQVQIGQHLKEIRQTYNPLTGASAAICRISCANRGTA